MQIVNCQRNPILVEAEQNLFNYFDILTTTAYNSLNRGDSSNSNRKSI